MALILFSPVFQHSKDMPVQYTCDGDNISPPLAWDHIPAGCKSLALIVDDPDAPDPDAPRLIWVHWVLYNIPTTIRALEGGASTENLPDGIREGTNDWHKSGYGGPCPPIGRHRYFHKLYALDVLLPDLQQPTKQVLERAMQGHILEYAELIGTYQRAK